MNALAYGSRATCRSHGETIAKLIAAANAHAASTLQRRRHRRMIANSIANTAAKTAMRTWINANPDASRIASAMDRQFGREAIRHSAISNGGSSSVPAKWV